MDIQNIQATSLGEINFSLVEIFSLFILFLRYNIGTENSVGHQDSTSLVIELQI